MFSTTVSTGSAFEAKSLDMEHRSQRNDVPSFGLIEICLRSSAESTL